MNDVIIIGGGLAGLTSAILLSRSGLRTILVEKHDYPMHKVCGEYVSNEAVPFLKQLGLFDQESDFPEIHRFRLSSTKGKVADMKLDLGGIGISRYKLDHMMYQKAMANGTKILLKSQVEEVSGSSGRFTVKLLRGEELKSNLVIGAYGKKSRIDNVLDRGFLQSNSAYVAVKYHLKYDQPEDIIALHNFEGGYCGISKIENDKYNMCYLALRKDLKHHGSIPAMEEALLYRNPLLKDIFTRGHFVFEKPVVINEFSFSKKKLIESDVLMCGDSAGLITPLCGNGMAMAIHSAKILSQTIIKNFDSNSEINYKQLQQEYTQLWRKKFASRLAVGRTVQNLFGTGNGSGIAVGLIKNFRPLAYKIMNHTHGKVF